MTRTNRLFHLMQALRSGAPPHTAAALARELEVSARTIHRDIGTLRGLGAVIDGAAGFGFSLIEDATLPPLGFDDDELEALVLGLREVGQIGDPDLSAATGPATCAAPVASVATCGIVGAPVPPARGTGDFRHRPASGHPRRTGGRVRLSGRGRGGHATAGGPVGDGLYGPVDGSGRLVPFAARLSGVPAGPDEGSGGDRP